MALVRSYNGVAVLFIFYEYLLVSQQLCLEASC